ncbi:tRNA pseudouridine(65) synthase TruC [Xenorhabdus griffiniae]|uniref:tRNA pseudouridine(65) synthase TruC n=1 Tax=Xenorhabdus griffiniae TaxID=351672 RepID=UPI00235A4692|nr:tRNA pseudouridine(65) synthase TruC [Xenorhabdus griffiniae]MDC9604810.1 tRNA pseudouridine(65) synthase TruC [Xenorhabdus griffiniae]
MLEIIYQDKHIVAVNKPAGWLVHRSWLARHETVFVMQTLRDQIGQHVFPVHRLDRPTSGVLLMALSSEVARTLAQQFECHDIQKTYHAVVRGYVEGDDIIDYALMEQLDKIADKFADTDRAAQPAVTYYRSLAKVECPVEIGRYPTSRFSLLELMPKTGRKHQLRRHMAHIRHPIIGDTTHGDLRQNRGVAKYYQTGRLMLHASCLQLKHPVTGERLLLTARWEQSWQHLIEQFGWQGIVPDLECLTIHE